MFHLFDHWTQADLYAPVTGKTINLESVPDKAFSSKMTGEGIAFQLEDDGLVCAPCDGKLTLIFPTLHAFGMMLGNGAEVLVHIGLETVSLNGQGFQKITDQGIKVKKGDPIIKVDLDYLRSRNVDLTTMLTITNSDDYKVTLKECEHVIRGRDLLLTCSK